MFCKKLPVKTGIKYVYNGEGRDTFLSFCKCSVKRDRERRGYKYEKNGTRWAVRKDDMQRLR